MMHVAGETKSRIARVIGCSRAAVDRALTCPQGREFRETAKDILRRHREAFVTDWIAASKQAAKLGSHKPAKDALVAIGEIEAQVTPPPLTVSLNFPLPGLPLPGSPPATPLPVINAARRLHSGDPE